MRPRPTRRVVIKRKAGLSAAKELQKRAKEVSNATFEKHKVVAVHIPIWFSLCNLHLYLITYFFFKLISLIIYCFLYVIYIYLITCLLFTYFFNPLTSFES